MAIFDLPIEQLRTYLPKREEPADFDLFWKTTLEEARSYPLAAAFTPVANGLQTIDSFDVSFSGYGGQQVRAWLNLPRQRTGPIPGVVEFLGYGGGRGYTTDWLLWASAGYAHLIMDTRGQGGSWRIGDTADLPDGANPSTPGFMTQGIFSPRTYYYRRLFTDTVRALETLRAFPDADPTRIAVTGGSQGGGMAIAAAGLDPSVAVMMPDVPFLCHYRRAVEITDSYPYQELVTFCKIHRDKIDTVFQTLAYFDGVNFAARAKAKALFSVALMDDTCPPSTVFAAYNHLPGEKEIMVYPYNRHEGGEAFHAREKLKFLNLLWKNP